MRKNVGNRAGKKERDIIKERTQSANSVLQIHNISIKYTCLNIQLNPPTISLFAKILIFPPPLCSPFVICQLRPSGWDSYTKHLR